MVCADWRYKKNERLRKTGRDFLKKTNTEVKNKIFEVWKTFFRRQR